MIEKYRFTCSCGWNYEHGYGVFALRENTYVVVERYVSKNSIHPAVKEEWKKLLQHPLMIAERKRKTPDLPSFLRYRRKREKGKMKIEDLSKTNIINNPNNPPPVYYQYQICTCYTCKNIQSYLTIYRSSDDQQLSKMKCFICANELTRSEKSHQIYCPNCKSIVKGTKISVNNI